MVKSPEPSALAGGSDEPDLRACLDRRFEETAPGGYVWTSRAGRFTVSVGVMSRDAGPRRVRVAVTDDITRAEVAAWSRDIVCREGWRETLQMWSGLSQVRAQHRPLCGRCRAGGGRRVPMVVRTVRGTGAQFFGCSNFPVDGCPYTLEVPRAFDDPDANHTPIRRNTPKQKTTRTTPKGDAGHAPPTLAAGTLARTREAAPRPS